MKSMKFGQVQMDSACVSRMGGSQPNPSLLSPEGKTSTKQMKIFFFFLSSSACDPVTLFRGITGHHPTASRFALDL